MAKIYEGSKADVAEDKREAKARGIPMSEWEGSAADEASDAQAEQKVARGSGSAQVSSNAPPHHFAHKRPMTG